MQGNRNRDTAPELAVRAILHRAGLRYRVAARPLPGIRWTADLVFRPALVAVFIDGCYWHMCPDHGRIPATNESYWRPKLLRKVERDKAMDDALGEASWLSMRFWAHAPPEDVAAAVVRAVSARRPPVSRRALP